MLSKSPEKTPEVDNEKIDQAPPPAEAPTVDPTRFGDWEKGGRCIDF
jgi:hypothetical protein